MTDIEQARQILRTAGVFFCDDPSELGDDQDPKVLQTLNLNDTWAWACADGEYVLDEDLPEVARLFFAYGWCGILYWVSERNQQCQSEFCDTNRFVEFVRNEEAIIREEPDDTKRAYLKKQYTIGVPEA